MSMGPVGINNLVSIVSLASRSTVCPEESSNLLLTVRPHPFHNELSQLSVYLLLVPFTAPAVGAFVRIRHLPGHIFSPGRSLIPVCIQKAKSGLSLAPSAWATLAGPLIHNRPTLSRAQNTSSPSAKIWRSRRQPQTRWGDFFFVSSIH